MVLASAGFVMVWSKDEYVLEVHSVDESLIRDQVFALVKELYEKRQAEKRFIPGQTAIPCSGKVYDHEEMISLVDSCLDFWLTSGRFAEEFEKKFAAFLGV